MARHLAFANGDKRKRPYWRDERLLGKRLSDQQHEEILVIGRDSWTRQEIVDSLHCGNFAAAHNLSKIAKKLDVESLDQLVSRYTIEDLFSETGFGVVTMYVLMCAQEAKKKDPIKWLDHKADEYVTLGTEKIRALKHKENEARTTRKRGKRMLIASKPAAATAASA